MEFNTEINKIFGEEMAKIFAAKITEEQLVTQAEKIWKEITISDRWNNYSELDKLIKTQLLKSLTSKITDIIETKEYQDKQEEVAKDIVKQVEQRTHEKIIEEISNRLSGRFYDSYGCRNSIANIVHECLHNR